MQDIDMWSSDQIPDAFLWARNGPMLPLASQILVQDMMLPAALDPEVISADKWLPASMDFHHH